jgi:energy-converting hydrogenase Eha subunit E
MSLRWFRIPRPFPWFACLVALGLGLRTYHYLVNHAVWHDEAALVNNVLGKTFTEYLGPLYYSEAAPPLFLALEKVVVLALGSGTYALRLLPFLASCAAFLGLAFIARRLLPAAALPWFLVLLGTSDRLLWHTCEAKPYAVDVVIAVGLLATLVGNAEAEPVVALRRRLLLYTALSPLLIFLSFPACFLLGAVALAWLPEVVRLRRPALLGLYGLFGIVLCASFLLLLTGPVRAQRDETLLDCWQTYFPTWDRPWRVPGCLLVRGTEVFRYAAEPIGNLLAGVAVVGAVVLWRGGQRRVLAFLLLPLTMTGLAWLVRQYPFGATRVMVFAAPAALLLIAAGLPAIFAWLGRRARFAPLLLAGVLLVPAVQAAYRVAWPWPRLDSAQPAAFVLRHRQPDEPVLGTLWEHAYYFRDLGPLYRHFQAPPNYPPTLPPTFDCESGQVDDAGRHVTRVWVVGLKGVIEQPRLLQIFPPAGAWEVVEHFDFRDMTALVVERRGSGTRVAATRWRSA